MAHVAPGGVHMDMEERGRSEANRDRWRASAATLEQEPRSHEESAHADQRRLDSPGSSVASAAGGSNPLRVALGDKRRHARRDWTARLYLVIEQRVGSTLGRLEADVQTKDLSRSGFSFIYRQYIPEGAMVNARIGSTPDAPTIRGQVRRCVHVGGMDHLIGVEFIKTSRS